MSTQNAIDIVLVVAVLGWIIYRQSRWQVLDRARVWRGPIIVAIIGLVQVKAAVPGAHLTEAAVGLLAFSAVLSLAVGAIMGSVSQLKHEDGVLWARTGTLGSMLWMVLIVVRIGVDVWAHSVGATIVSSIGVILLMLALNRVGRSAMLLRRAEKLPHYRGRPIGAH
jgi:hypothetical protein